MSPTIRPAAEAGRGPRLLLVGGGVRVVELLAHPHGGPDERRRRGLVTRWCAGGLAEAGAVDEGEGAEQTRQSSTPSAESFVASCEVCGGR